MIGLRKKKRIYADYASSTPMSSQVFKAMKYFMKKYFYNPSAIYKEGVYTRRAIDTARDNIANILDARKKEIYFVDGATEANNLALVGLVRAWKKNHPKEQAHIITSTIEHSAILEACKYLEGEGVEVTYLSVDQRGSVDINAIKKSLKKTTVAISVGYVNGEIGVIQDLRSIAKLVRHARKNSASPYPYFHTDAVQALNYVEEMKVSKLGVDLMTINASKIYGPKKIGVLYVKAGTPIEPLFFGGDQEFGLRPGTENVPAIVGIAKAVIETRTLRESESKRLRRLQQYLEDSLANLFPNLVINGQEGERIPNITNMTFPDISHEELVIRLDAKGIMCSVQSACKSDEEGDSHVIKALRGNNKNEVGTQSLRLSFGRMTKKSDINIILSALGEITQKMNATYEKYTTNS